MSEEKSVDQLEEVEEKVDDISQQEESAENDTVAEAPEIKSDVEASGDEASDNVVQDEKGSSTVTAEGADWYIVQCYSAQEYKVRDRILQMVEDKGYEDRVFRVLVPEEETIELKNNKRIEKITKIFPGYVFVQIKLDEDVFYEIRAIAGVSKFIGTKNAPTPVTEDEILKVLRKMGDKTKKIDVDFEVDEVIKVISGPFRGYTGPISEINGDKGNLKAMISIFGRETPVLLDFDQVEKAVA